MQIWRQVCVQTHSKPCWWKEIDCCSHSIDWWTTGAVTENSVGKQDPIPSETSSSREQIRYQKGTYTWSHADRISKSATSKLSNIRGTIYRMDFEHGRKRKERSLEFYHKNAYTVPGSFSFFTFYNHVGWENSLWTRELHFMWWVKVILFQVKRNDSNVERSIRYYDCKWNYSYGWNVI